MSASFSGRYRGEADISRMTAGNEAAGAANSEPSTHGG
jgi:hypothetical protein